MLAPRSNGGRCACRASNTQQTCYAALKAASAGGKQRKETSAQREGWQKWGARSVGAAGRVGKRALEFGVGA